MTIKQKNNNKLHLLSVSHEEVIIGLTTTYYR